MPPYCLVKVEHLDDKEGEILYCKPAHEQRQDSRMLLRYAPRFDPFEGIFCVTELQAGCVRKPTTDPTSTLLWWSGSQSANVYVWHGMFWNHWRKQNWCDNYLLKMRRFTRSWLTKPTKSSQIKVTLSSRVSETHWKKSSVLISLVTWVLCTPIHIWDVPSLAPTLTRHRGINYTVSRSSSSNFPRRPRSC